MLRLVAIICKSDSSRYDSKDEQKSPIVRCGGTSIVHHAVIREAVVVAELVEGGLEAMGAVGNISPRSHHDNGHEELADEEYNIALPQKSRADRNHYSINGKRGSNESRDRSNDENAALERCKIVVSNSVCGIDRVGSRSVSQNIRKVRLEACLLIFSSISPGSLRLFRAVSASS